MRFRFKKRSNLFMQHIKEQAQITFEGLEALKDYLTTQNSADAKLLDDKERAADEVRESSRQLPKVSPPPADQPSFWVEGGGTT